MPRLSVTDCEVLLRLIEERPVSSSDALRATGRLRQRLQQAGRGEMSAEPSPSQRRPTRERDSGALRSCTLHVCTSCRQPGSSREPRESRPGFILYRRLRETFEKTPLRHRVEVVPAECLSVCPRPCGLAISSPGAWTYLFGDQQAGENAHDIVACASLYLEAVDGFMPRDARPKRMRGSILGRVPPLEEESTREEPSCT